MTAKRTHGFTLFMSLIHTCRLGGFNPFDYLSALVRNAAKVRTRLEQWLPWNFRETLEIDGNTS